MSFINVENISKTFKVAQRKSGLKATLKSFFKRKYFYIEAVKNISFQIEKGDIVGYIGPNGAGKSTTIKMLSGILLPDQGKIEINNMIPALDRQKYVANIGVVFGQRSQLWWDLPALDSFDLLKNIYKLKDDQYQKTIQELIGLLELDNIVQIPVRQLSLGQRMRCEIAASLIHNPSILFLDEPTIGLDATSKQIVRNFIKRINKERKTTIILTTHDMNDIEALAKRIILIGKGQVLYDGTIKHLKQKYGNYCNVIVTTKNILKTTNKKGIISKEKITDGYIFKIDINQITVSEFLKYLATKVKVDDVEINNESIDDLIIKLYKEFEI